MSIIANIRFFLGLDKKTVSLENEFVYKTGFFTNEWQYYLKNKNSYVPEMDCLGHHSYSFNFDGFHSPHVSHVIHS